jgi:predicted AAA+ superfamily ATPase
MGVSRRISEARIDYRPRIVDRELADHLAASGAVVIEGPRGCGKTETARRAAASEVRLDVDDRARSAGLIDPSLLLRGDRPRLIDEWQLVPAVWDHARRAVDELGGQPGQFILTGSAIPSGATTRHTGALRFSRLRMRPMSLAESGHSSGEVTLGALLDGAEPRAADPGLTIDDLVERICVGGWPSLQGRSVAAASVVLRGYLDQVARVDLVRIDGIARDPANIARVLRSLGRHVATRASARAIAADVGGAEGPIDPHTALDYLAAMARLFVVEDQPAWSPAIRSRTLLRAAPVRHLTDPSLAVAALGAGPQRLLRDVETLGLLFESLVIRDLRVYAAAQDAQVLAYRDSTDLEVDAIVERRDATWAAFEVKLGPGQVDDAARTLLRLAERVDVERHGRPATLGVITGWGYAYRRPDGVAVVPIGTLGP